MRTRFCQNYFLGKGFRKTSADFLSLHFVRAEDGLGNECGRVKLYKTGEIKIEAYIKNRIRDKLQL